MAGKQAKILSEPDEVRLLALLALRPNAARDRAVLLLSLKAGLRAGEIAALRWPMLLAPDGRLGHVLELPDVAAKARGGRTIPLHPQLRQALAVLRRQAADDGPVIRSVRGRAMTAGSLVNWFADLYREAGLGGCSSHSGRRTFVTRAARMVHAAGGSLRDVQQLAGHRSIETTQRYIEGDTAAKRRLVALL